MAKNKRKSRKSTKLPEGLEKRLGAYALAAAAAGMGVLAAATPAWADIITNTNPTSVAANSQGTLNIHSSPVLRFKAHYNVSYGTSSGSGFGSLYLYGETSRDGFILTPLAKSSSIGPSKSFFSYATLATNYWLNSVSGVYGPWANKTGYLGFKFVSNSNTYFGWAHLKVTASPHGGETAYISEFAYNDVAGQSIKAGQTAVPEPGTLSLLALGAVGLFALRRKKLAGSN